MDREKFEYEYSYLFDDIPEAKLRGTFMTVAVEGKRTPIEKTIRAFKRRVKDSGKIDELKGRQEFIKKSAVRRRELSAAINRTQKLLQIAREEE